MDVLIVGGGIAGLTAAFWLERLGHRPTVLERAPALRAGGYVIDFCGPGYTIAERMGLEPALMARHVAIPALRYVDATGREQFRVDVPALRRRVYANRHVNVTRGDIEELIYERINGAVPMHFGTTVTALTQEGERVTAALSDGTRGTYDLVVGADGLHSRTRALAFGPEGDYLRPLGYTIAVADLPAAPPSLGGDGWLLTAPGRHLSLYPAQGGGLTALFLYRAAQAPADRDAARDDLARRYGDLGWVVPSVLAATLAVPDLYYDPVAQIVMPRWQAGRVGLVGDAGGCVSLLAGQGTSLAVSGAYALAREIGRADRASGDVAVALARYEARVRPTVVWNQANGRQMAHYFVPETRWGIAARDLITRLSTLPPATGLARRFLGGRTAPL